MEERKTLSYDDPRCASMTAAIYCRKSTATEGKSKSRDQQLEMCQRDAEGFGFGTVLVFMEEEGQKGNWFWRDPADRHPGPHRPELTRLMDMIARGQVQAIVCYKMDRLVRSTEVMVALRRELKTHGVRLIAQGRDCELDTARGKYQNTVDSAVAEQWRDQISEDIKRDHDYKARMGMFSRNPSCLGYRSKGRDSQAVDPQPEEIALVNRIFKLFVVGEDARGPLGISGICKKLMDDGVTVSVGAKGHRAKNPKKIYTSQISTILRNVMYVGRWRHNGNEYTCDRLLISDPETGDVRTAVPAALFEAAQAKLASAPTKGKKAVYSDHLLSGIAVCGVCGRPLHINCKRRKDGSTRKNFYCARARDTIPCNRDGTARLFESQVDDWVLDCLSVWITAELRARHEISRQSDDHDRLAELQRLLAAAKKKETESLAAVVGVLDSVQVGELAAKFRAEREILDRKIKELEPITAGAQRVELVDNLACLDRAAAKAAIREAIRWIAVTAKGVVALTAWGTYVGGALIASRPTPWNLSEPRRTVLPPTLASCAECLFWLPDPSTFLQGRRQVLGERAKSMLDDELLPGIESLTDDKENKCA